MKYVVPRKLKPLSLPTALVSLITKTASRLRSAGRGRNDEGEVRSHGFCFVMRFTCAKLYYLSHWESWKLSSARFLAMLDLSRRAWMNRKNRSILPLALGLNGWWATWVTASWASTSWMRGRWGSGYFQGRGALCRIA